jgi:hypothetical protein
MLMKKKTSLTGAALISRRWAEHCFLFNVFLSLGPHFWYSQGNVQQDEVKHIKKYNETET